MRVVRTPVKNQPSNVGSRATLARSQVRNSSVNAASLTAAPSVARGVARDDDVRKRRDISGAHAYRRAQRMASTTRRYFYGWNVVAATVVVALFAFGLGFYGLSVYVAALQRLHGWSAAAVSAPVTVYYIGGAVLSAWIAAVYERFGPRLMVAVGTCAMALGVSALGVVTEPWHLYPVFLVMAVGWGSMSGAALNILVAPWFERRRGLAVSLAFNGATLGGVVIAPALIPLIGALGFRRALLTAALAMLVVLLPIAVTVMRRGPETVGLGPDGDAVVEARTPAPVGTADSRRAAVRTWRFWSVSAPFALGLAAQVGVLTHQVSLLTPALGAGGAARAVGLTTFAGVVGRLATGFVVDHLNRRVVASVTLVLQLVGVSLLARGGSAASLYAGCVLFGLGVGNLTTLPGLIVAVEWPRERFAALIGLVVAINQFTFAFGPSLVGVVHDWSGRYSTALGVCMGLQALAATLVLVGARRRRL
jgi:MFS family permease